MHNVFVAVPTYDGRLTIQTSEFLHDIRSDSSYLSDVHFDSQDSLILRSRNNLINKFYSLMEESGYTHMLWLDSDIALESGSVRKLLERNVDVIAVPYSIKMPPSRHGIVQVVSGVYDEIDSMFYRVKMAGTGAIMLSRSAVLALLEYCEKNEMFYFDVGEKKYDVFRTETTNGTYLSEDWYVCVLLGKLGYDIYVDSSLASVHVRDQNIMYVREAMPVSENVLNRTFLPIQEDLIEKRWTENDLRV